MYAADDRQQALVQWRVAQANVASDSIPEDAVVAEWDCPHHGALRFLSDGTIALATTVPRERVAIYALDGQEVQLYQFGLQSAYRARIVGEIRFANGCTARGYKQDEKGKQVWMVEIFSPDGEKLAEHNYGPECIRDIWIEHNTISANGRYSVSRWAGPLRARAVITDTATGDKKELGQVGMPDFSPDGNQVAFYAGNKVTICSCDQIFSQSPSVKIATKE